MNLSAIKRIFSTELSEIYTASELAFMFPLFVEKFTGNSRMLQRLQPEFILNAIQETEFKTALNKLKSGEPYQYVLGETEFFGLKFFVNKNVLIPRPETEELLELALKQLDKRKKLKILDIGTGSGIIPVVLKKHLPEAEIDALDISAEAIKVAEKNAEFHGLKINFQLQDYLHTPLCTQYDVIFSNPPYIGKDESKEIAESVKDFEPVSALFSPTEDPLIFYRKIARDASIHLGEQGLVFLEINQKLGAETAALFKSFSECKLIKDLSGNDRMLLIRK